ncbi:flagellar basal-body rod protein FlgG [Oceanospirillum multiglobuliferum]|uniref:Flagellar basal-body rod protein FlgG n=1 Tax=Oceanospirillum multiglobuliferum TaxID=64969 RepID=A0A1T4RK79_9GAMM|nr:flagellar basal-body rod protein FlgG [Oceanospirillum multiglobuliferum]OPX54819.1 flagellar basal-body rod protein FlgG [Oceanospirillum multiglobuliferum]SKA16081.1 flagellar basal-body rod protein FlgG [Oceanospirillum multiglobuliferum]
MHAALWVSKTGLSAQDTQLRVVSNNLANVSTVGFKKERAIFQDLLYQQVRQPGSQSSLNTQLPSGLQLGTGVRTVATQKMHTDSSLQVTEQPLDMAIDGRGFFQIQMPDGTLAYSRNGQFQLNSEGQIVNAQGFLLEPEIQVPANAQSVSISRDGIVSVRLPGETAENEIGQITVADFVNPAGLESFGGNLYRQTGASGEPIVDVPGNEGIGTTEQGMLENSNVNAVEELVNMISTQRAYEMNSKVVSTADSMLRNLTQTL